MIRVTKKEREKIIKLRKEGKTIIEIGIIVHRPKSTVSRQLNRVVVSDKIKILLKSRRIGSKNRAIDDWNKAKTKAGKILRKLSDRDKVLITTALYWGEGSRKEFNIINSDPYLLATVVGGLKVLGISKTDIKIGLRLYKSTDRNRAIKFWSKVLHLPIKNISHFEYINKTSKGKFIHGMCRIRVRKGKDVFKLIMSMIHLIKEKNATVVQWIEQDTPNV